jgi:hypothetical protein
MRDRGELLVVAAAIRTADGRIWSVPAPGRHHNVIRFINEKLGGDNMPEHEQGFLLSDGRFVRRKPALFIAQNAGQILRETAPQHGLFSEDVW